MYTSKTGLIFKRTPEIPSSVKAVVGCFKLTKKQLLENSANNIVDIYR